jgi:hypothetical protein
LNIWVEPLEWKGPEDQRPIRQLDVKITNLLGGDPVRGSRAVSEVDSQCKMPNLHLKKPINHLLLPGTVHYSISRLTGTDTDVRAGLQAAKLRQFREYIIPTGVENVKEWWEQLNFSGAPSKDGEPSVPYNKKNFAHPDDRIRKLRSLSRFGRDETEKLALEEFGKPKYVLGEPEPIPWDVLHAMKQDPHATSVATPLEAHETSDMDIAVVDHGRSPEVLESDPEPVDSSTAELVSIGGTNCGVAAELFGPDGTRIDASASANSTEGQQPVLNSKEATGIETK